MKRYSLLIILLISIGCKKESPKLMGAPLPIMQISENKKEKRSIEIDSLQLKKNNNKLLITFYQAKEYKTVWINNALRKTVIDLLEESDEEGLNPQDYDINQLQNFEQNAEILSDLDLAKFDLLLTSNLQKYISHLNHGRLNPRNLYRNWDLKDNKIDLNKAISELLNGDSINIKIERLKPNHIVYQKLKDALKIINSYPPDHFKKIVLKGKIILNDSNSTVISIKKRLIYWEDLKPKDSITMNYDNDTFEALKKFQKRHGLAPDGKIGSATIESLNFSKEDRKHQIIVNLERWKWFPKNMGEEYIIINIPDYKLTLVKNKDTLRTHRVIVGRPKRKTPVLSSKLTQVIFNPTWTVPPTILREDVIPAILKNRNYLAQTNIRLFDQNGNRVSATNWQLANAKSYRYVQTPGTFNSLGMVKLIFPNRFSVYLHDTNHRDFFTKTERSLSSGCVRVDNPLELTEYVLNDPVKWNLNKITETLSNEKTIYVNIKKNIAFHLLYWTAWSENGKLIFRDDIYNLDADLYKTLNTN